MSARSSTETLIAALRVLARDIQSDDGVANAAIAEAADRLEELESVAVAAEDMIRSLSRFAKAKDDAANRHDLQGDLQMNLRRLGDELACSDFETRQALRAAGYLKEAE